MKKGKKITLKMEGPISYTTKIDESLAGRIISMCAMVESVISNSVNHTGLDEHKDNTVPGSIVEYMDKYIPKRNPDKILVIAAYLTEVKNNEFFKPIDIKPYFPKAGEPIPGNFNRDFKWLQVSKWIAEAEDRRGFFYVTKKGLDVVHGGFPKELVTESRGKSAISRRRKKHKK